MTTLFDLTQEILDLESAILATDDDDEKQAIAESYFSKEDDIASKLDSYAAMIDCVKNRLEVRRQRVKELQALIGSDTALIDRLKSTLQWYFEARQLTRIETPEHRFVLAKNGGKAPLDIDENIDVDAIPDEFIIVEKNINKSAIREALESGEKLDFARLGDRGQSVRIK